MGFPVCSAGEIAEEALKNYLALIPQKQKKLMNRAGILSAIAALLAVQEARLEEHEVESACFGIFLATWFTAYDLASFVRYLQQTESKQDPGSLDSEKANTIWLEKMNPVDFSLKVLPNLSAGHLAILHRAQGCSRTIADSWRGGLLAVAQGAEAIRRGELEIVLAGGSESTLEGGVFNDLCRLDMIARENRVRDGICRPFDVARHGAVLGEGAGVVVLEERHHALRRGANIYGEIIGSSSSAPTPPTSKENSLALSMKRALVASGLDTGQVDFIHANGDSTRDNDRAEWVAIQRVFGSRARTIPVTAVKSLHGHLLSAAGAVELISSLLILEKGIIPPIANCDNPDPECMLDLVRVSAREKPGMNVALLNAAGLFGEGASLVIER
jgi:3-oxoacyl-[acyl-carrier-protein] synthase II